MGNEINIYNFIDRLENKMVKNNETFFSYSWREKFNELLSNESRFVSLVEWINEKIDFETNNMNVFNPADKDEFYTKDKFNTYLDSCRNLAFLMNCKWIILDKNCNTKIRENIEYAICKFFGIKFIEGLNCYQ